MGELVLIGLGLYDEQGLSLRVAKLKQEHVTEFCGTLHQRHAWVWN